MDDNVVLRRDITAVANEECRIEIKRTGAARIWHGAGRLAKADAFAGRIGDEWRRVGESERVLCPVGRGQRPGRGVGCGEANETEYPKQNGETKKRAGKSRAHNKETRARISRFSHRSGEVTWWTARLFSSSV